MSNENAIQSGVKKIYASEKLLTIKERREIVDNNKEKKLALIYADSEKSAPFRYRCFNTTTATKESNEWQSVYFTKQELGDVKQLLPKASLLIIERQSSKDGIAIELIEKARQENIIVLFDLDDLVFSLRYLFLVMKATGSLNILFWGAYILSLRKIAKKVDGFLTTNDFIGQKLQKTFRKPYQVIQNSLNEEQIKASEKIKKKDDKKFTIGYFSGSPTHKKDLELASSGIARFLDDHTDAQLRIVGFMELPKILKKDRYKNQIEIIPPVPYKELQGLISNVDVNIAPLVENDFTNCKSELKFFEASVVETITIASPTYAFKNSIIDGVTGFLCGKDEWFEKLNFVYNNQEKCKKIVKAAREYCVKRYSGENYTKEIEQAYDYFTK